MNLHNEKYLGKKYIYSEGNFVSCLGNVNAIIINYEINYKFF